MEAALIMFIIVLVVAVTSPPTSPPTTTPLSELPGNPTTTTSNDCPKTIPRSAINHFLDDIPVLQMFFEHLLSSEGGVKEHDEGLEHMRRVGRLLYEVQEPPKDVELLWDDDSMTLIRRRFFDGNHLLTEPREPGTLLAYIASLRMFYMFIKGRRTGVSKLIPMNIETIACVDEMLARIDKWGKSSREAMNARKRVVQGRSGRDAVP